MLPIYFKIHCGLAYLRERLPNASSEETVVIHTEKNNQQ